MRICLFADIHGNGAAFKAAYGMIVSEKADINIFLGDLCGYYYDQLDIFDMLKTIPNLRAIRGNHDVIFLNILEGNEGLRKTYLEKYGHSMEILLEKDVTELKAWLIKVPETYSPQDLNVICCHGSPWDVIDGYVYPDSPIEEFLKYSPDFFFLGHTHYPMKRSIQEKLIVNPGSLGQARNGGWPTYAVVDYYSQEISIKEVVYDKSDLIKQIDEAGDSKRYLRKILER